MALEMKLGYQGCAAPLGWQDEALICSYECSWCRTCAEGDGLACINCGGELVPWPPRETKPS